MVPAPLLEKKILKTEKVKTIGEVHKRPEKITTSDDVVKGNYWVHKRTEKLQQIRGLKKELKDLKI